MEYTYIHNHQSQFIEWFGDVEYIPLKNVCLRIGEYGSNTPATDYDGSVRYLRITDINDDGSLGNEIVSPSTIEEKYYLQTNDFVFARTGNTVGKTYLHTSGKMIYAGYLIRYKLDETCVLPKFLLAYTHTSLFWDWVSKMKKVGAQPNISAQQYNELPIPRAEIASQQRFVSIAEQADKSKFDGFKSQFIEMFGDFDKSEWPNMTFTEFAKIDAQMTSDFDSYSEYPHIGIESIQQNTGHILNYKTVKEDAVQSGKYVFTSKHIIYSKIRPNLNKVATPDFDGLCSADAYPILPKFKVVRKEFLAFILRSSIFLDYIIPFSRRTGMPKVNREQVEGFQLHMPPLPLQDEFLTISNQADKSKFELKRAIEAIDKVIKSLING